MLKLFFVLSMASGAAAEQKHTVVPQDTLWDLAGRYYKNHFQWRRIAEANPAPNVKDPHWIYPGQVLVIPDLEEAPEALPEPPERSPRPQPEPPPEPEPEAPQAAEEPAPAPPPPPPPAPAPIRASPRPEAGLGSVPAEESLSTKFPTGLVAASASERLIAPPGWSPDGKVAGFNGQETMAAAGDAIDLMIDQEPRPKSGDRFTVYRKTAPTEADADKSATYLVKIGVVQVRKTLASGRFRAIILTSNDSLQLDDLAAREE